MIKWLIILLFPFAACGQTQVFGVISGGGASGDTVVYTGKTNVFIGDSYFEGNFYNPGGGIAIPAGFATETSSTADNQGRSGRVLQDDGVPCTEHPVYDQTLVPTYVDGTHGLIFVALGTNDVGMNINGGSMNPTDYQAALEDFIDYINTTKGWPLLRIVVVTPYYTTQAGRDLYTADCAGTISVAGNSARLIAYVNAAIAGAAAKGTQINDMYQSQVDTGNPDALMSGDGVHPNTTGAHFITYKLARPYYL